jgi:hypothetical protein
LKLNALDLLVTVSLGSVDATVVVSRAVAWVEAAAAICGVGAEPARRRMGIGSLGLVA